jgi:hydrogenase nickel incorporation protein HypA/HybF
MHELSLCHSIFSIVDRAREGRTVETVHIQVGKRRQVMPETLEYYWRLLTEQSPLAGSELTIEYVPVQVLCHACGRTTATSDRLMLECGECGSSQVMVVAGDEFMVTMMDVRDESELIHG